MHFDKINHYHAYQNNNIIIIMLIIYPPHYFSYQTMVMRQKIYTIMIVILYILNETIINHILVASLYIVVEGHYVGK